MHRNDTTYVRRKIWLFKQFCKFQLEEGVNAILKKVGQYLQNDSYLISYTIKLVSKLKLRYSTFIRWDDLVCRLSNLHIYQ